MSILDHPTISRIRRNHGLEHATIHLLSRRFPRQSFAGHSDAGGFWLMGEVETEVLADAVIEALARMRNGEHDLAVHPNCGTNFATYGVAAGFAAFLGMAGAGERFRDKLERLPLVILLATLALIVSQPFGYRIQQKVTTSGHPGDLEVMNVIRSVRGRMTAHRVKTRG